MSDSTLTATVPSGATAGPVTVTTPGGAASATVSPFTSPAPTIAGVSTNSVVVGGTLFLRGTNFTTVTSVSFGGIVLGPLRFTVNSVDEIKLTVPVGAVTGTVSVTTPAGTGTSASVTVTSAPTPTITALTPTTAPINAVVVINGTNFTPTATVRFNGVPVDPFNVTFVSPTELRVQVPSSTSTGPVVVTTATGNATSSAFIVTAPMITAITATSGAAGAQVVISGGNFSQVLSVKFNGVEVPPPNVQVDSLTQIIVTVPLTAATGTITVTTPGGTATSSSFTVLASPTPTIAAVTPGSGAIQDKVIITGTGFETATVVSFNGRSAVHRRPIRAGDNRVRASCCHNGHDQRDDEGRHDCQQRISRCSRPRHPPSRDLRPAAAL